MKYKRRDFIKFSSLCLAAPMSIVESYDRPLPAKGYGTEQGIFNGNDASVNVYDKWLWIELIGFDNTLADYGVDAFIKNTGFIPNSVSFLLTSPDFVHGHKGMATEWTFPKEICSYGARPFSKERGRQAWTNFQLKGLIDNLHRYKVAVYCSFFDFFVDEPAEGRWANGFSEIRETNKDGERYHYILPLKRFADGSLYEDLFLKKLLEVVQDYNFDGFHGADGYTSGRRPLNDVDYSDDMVDQFTSATAVQLPKDLRGKLDGKKELFAKRSSWIWQHARQEWISFYVTRWTSFWSKVVSNLHGIQKKVVFNTAWTRDPFEAIYRYGIDYRKIFETGIDGFIVEMIASAVAMEPGLSDDYKKFHYNAMAMMMLIKAQSPKATLRPFTQIHDTFEQYDALRHVPTVVEREIFSVANLYVLDETGKPNRCSSGPMCCLSDGVDAEEWAWLKTRWDLGFSDLPESIVGATLIWSDAALGNQLEDYMTTRRWTTHKLLYELMACGAPISAVANINNINSVKGPIVVLHPQLFPKEELNQLLSYKNGAVIFVGGSVELSRQPDFQFGDGSDNHFSCAVYNGNKPSGETSFQGNAETAPIDIQNAPEPDSWTASLFFREVSDDFVKACAQTLIDAIDAPKVNAEAADSIRIIILGLKNNRWRLLIGNDSFYYVTPKINMPKVLKSIKVKTPFPNVPVNFNKQDFSVRVPGRGMVILDVEME